MTVDWEVHKFKDLDKGPFIVWEDTNDDKEPYICSEDGKHDCTIKVDGDFVDKEEKCKYLHRFAAFLNEAEINT